MGQFKSALDEARKELDTALREQQALETRIVRLNQAIDALAALEKEFVFPLPTAPLTLMPNAPAFSLQWPIPAALPVSTPATPAADPVPTLTEACKNALIARGGFMSPVEVKEQMELSGFSFSKHENPMAFVHSTLKRFAENGRASKDETSGKTLYKWIGLAARRRALLGSKVPGESK